MKRSSQIGAALLVACVALAAQPARAQYANEFSIAKVIKEGAPSHDIAGSGEVQVQVQVNADGTHKVIKVLKSTNPGDNAAAIDIANTSTYRPARKGQTPQTSFYTFYLKFNGKAVVQQSDGGEASGGAASGDDPVQALVRSGKYDQAIARANSELMSSPGNPRVLQDLGQAQFFNKDALSAAKTFSRVDTIGADYKRTAAQAFASAAVQLANSDSATALTYAQKAVALSPDGNSQFSLGFVQVASQHYADAIAPLNFVHEHAATNSVKLEVDKALLAAYLGLNQQSDVDRISAEMKQLDPNGNSAATAIATHYLVLGNTALGAKDFNAAFTAYDQAARSGDEKVAGQANLGAASALMQMPKPDYGKAKGYADKAASALPDDATANFLAGVAYAQYWNGTSHAAADKTQAVTYLKKADALAKAANNVGLSLQIENTLKQISP